MEDKDKSVLDLEKYKFAYSQGMQKQWVESNGLFLTYMAAKYRQSARVSLLAGKVVITEVDKELVIQYY